MPVRRSLWDRALGAFGLARTSTLTPRAQFAGAAGGRLNGDWFMSALSVDQAIRADGVTLRTRARELVDNNSTASRVPTLFSENVIGKDGIIPQPRVLSSRSDDGRPRYNKAVNAAIDAAWWEWYKAENASVDHQSSWCELETLITETEPTDGEVLIRLVDNFENPFGFAIEILDVAQLEHTYNRPRSDTQNEIKMGVEIDRWGRPLTYHILANHPSEIRRAKRYFPVAASDIIHLFIRRRPKQTRGLTWFAPVIVDLKMHGGYREAELVAARAGASKMGFLQSLNPDGIAPPIDPEAGEDHVRFDADPGVVEQLPPGMEFKEWDPSHPTTAFAEFDKAILRSIATALRVSYMSLSSDLSDTTYGSGRIGLLAERAVYQKLQQRLIERVHTRVYRRWLRSALLKGAIRLDSYDATRYHAVTWHPRSFPWIDPAADIEAAEKELAMGLTSVRRLAAAQGRDVEEVADENEADMEVFKSRGLPHPYETIQAEIEAAKQPAAPPGAVPASGPKRVASA